MGQIPNPDGSDARMTRGMAIAERNVISENSDGSFTIPSQTREGVSYEVRLIGNSLVCNCPDFENRADEIEACKHAFAVKFWIASNVYLQEKPKPKIFSEDSIQCDKCGSIRIVKFGHADGKQVFKCRDCKHKFREASLLRKSKYNADLVTLTLDLYFSGLSLRKIARTIGDHYDFRLGYTTIYSWIQRYVPLISQYVSTLTPQLSDTWHADELFVKMKGGINHQKSKNMAFLWNVMDRRTRFLLASKLSSRRDVYGASQAFKEAVKNARGSEPERIVTDSLRGYSEAIDFAFLNRSKPEHIAKAGIKKRHATNNRIERLNGTLRERVKVQRGWKSMHTPIAEGQRIHYNFVKRHMALEGRTPAEASGIDVGQNRWGELLLKALGSSSPT